MSELEFIPLNDNERQLLNNKIAKLCEWYGAIKLGPINQCEFLGTVNDICALDYIFYELGGTSWNWDNGLTHAATWGNVAVTSFGFEWCKVSKDAPINEWAVCNTEVPCIVFPWPRLFEIEHNYGHGHGLHAYLLLSTIKNVDDCHVAPNGWHPVLDAIQGKRPDIPKDVQKRLDRLNQCDPDWIYHLDLYPYDWGKQTDWNQVRSIVNSYIHNATAKEV